MSSSSTHTLHEIPCLCYAMLSQRPCLSCTKYIIHRVCHIIYNVFVLCNMYHVMDNYVIKLGNINSIVSRMLLHKYSYHAFKCSILKRSCSNSIDRFIYKSYQKVELIIALYCLKFINAIIVLSIIHRPGALPYNYITLNITPTFIM